MIHIDITCDECDELLMPQNTARTVEDARAHAAEWGWVFYEGCDYCPKHAPEGVKEENDE